MPGAQKREIIEKLIELIRRHPVIYDLSLREHRDVGRMAKVWDGIADGMGDPNINGKGWKKKWIGLRDTYMRQKREKMKMKSGEVNPFKKTWVFFEIMSFLDTVNGGQSFSESTYTAPSPETDEVQDAVSVGIPSDDEQSYPILPVANDDIIQNSIPSSSTSHPAADHMPSQHWNWKLYGRKRHKEEYPSPNNDLVYSEIVEDIKRSRTENNERTHDHQPDEDDAFFQSCRLRIKKLPPQTRSFLKLQVSQLFFNAENPSFSPVPIIPLPPYRSHESASTTFPYHL